MPKKSPLPRIRFPKKKKKTRVVSGGNPGRSRKRRKQSPLQRAWKWVWLRLKRILLAAGICLALYLSWTWMTLPSVRGLATAKKNPGVMMLDMNGSLVASYGEVTGEFIPYDDLPEALVKAVLATEDRNFYYHVGIDPLGLARAMWVNFSSGKVKQGGSTITQQLAKNMFLSSERSLSRKFREALLALKLELHYSKEDILAIYLNRVYLGAGNFGIDAASKRYFNKSGRKINLEEAALLTGLLKAPSRFAPTSNPQLARQRAEQVLINMEDAGYLNEAMHQKASKRLLSMLSKKQPESSSSHYFTDWVMEQIPDYIGEVEEDIIVYTTFNPVMQSLAAAAIKKALEEQGQTLNVEQGALVAMSPQGEVRAIIGGKSYAETQYNRATQSKRQPGSAFKMFVYVNAFEHGAWPDMTVDDSEIQVGSWAPKNYTREYAGLITLREAVARSINSVAVLMSETYGRSNVIALAHNLGITSDLQPTPSLALGAYEVSLMEITTAYAHLASGGYAVYPYGIREIKTKSGKSLYKRSDSAPPRVLSANVVGMANDVLQAVVNGGTGGRANIGRPMAGKTGTTSDYKDAWFIGYTPDIAVGVWVGNDTPTKMKKVTGGGLPAEIWRIFTQSALEGVAARPLPIARRSHGSGNLPWESGGSIGGDHAPAHLPANGTNTNADTKPAENPQIAPYDEPEILGESFWRKLGIGQ